MNKTMKVPFLLRQGQITKADRTDLHTGDNSRRAQDSEKLIRKKWDSRASITSQVEERRNTELNNYLETFQMKVLEAYRELLAIVEEIILLSDLRHMFITDYAFFLKSVRNVEHNTAMGLRKTLS